MRYKYYIALTFVAAAGLALTALLHLKMPWIVGSAILLLVAVSLLARAVNKPLRAVENGIYLLREQDFASRLRSTGQPDADRLVVMFNSMMDYLKAERLYNREQDQLLSQLIEAIPSGVAICDLDGNIVKTNSAFDHMTSPALLDALNSLEDDDTVTLRTGVSQIYGCSRLWFMDSGFRRRFYIIRPLTDEIVQAEKQLLTRMVRTIGHEVNNAMGSTLSVLESIADTLPTDSFEHSAIESCSTSCHNLVNFVQRYASLVKLPSPTLRPTDLTAELSRLLPQLQALAGSHITVTVSPSAPSTLVMADPTLLERVIVNIVKNSAESIGSRQGTITITIHDTTLTVSDDGPGINPQDADKLFTPFFSTKHPDRGLGLMLIADILRAHHATFSLATNITTTFTITLPKA